jgi:hypothetical protein
MLDRFRRIPSKIRSWWRAWRRQSRFSGVAYIDPTDDPTSALRQQKLVLVGDRDRAKWLRFSCPCQCGATLALNLMQRHVPHWTVDHHDDGTLSVFPSVDATECGSHFWIRHGRVDWV